MWPQVIRGLNYYRTPNFGPRKEHLADGDQTYDLGGVTLQGLGGYPLHGPDTQVKHFSESHSRGDHFDPQVAYPLHSSQPPFQPQFSEQLPQSPTGEEVVLSIETIGKNGNLGNWSPSRGMQSAMPFEKSSMNPYIGFQPSRQRAYTEVSTPSQPSTRSQNVLPHGRALRLDDVCQNMVASKIDHGAVRISRSCGAPGVPENSVGPEQNMELSVYGDPHGSKPKPVVNKLSTSVSSLGLATPSLSPEVSNLDRSGSKDNTRASWNGPDTVHNHQDSLKGGQISRRKWVDTKLRTRKTRKLSPGGKIHANAIRQSGGACSTCRRKKTKVGVLLVVRFWAIVTF